LNLKSRTPVHLANSLLTLILGGLQTLMPLSTDLYLPALPSIARDLNASPGAAQFTLSVFMIGVAVGQIAYGPITDKYGRKKPLMIGLVVYVLGAFVCALASSMNALIVGRLVQAFGASASAVITTAIARDLWSDAALADRLSMLYLVVGFAPIFAPSLGGLILTQANWSGLFWFLMAFGILVAVSVALLPETSSSHERAQVQVRDAVWTYAALLRNRPFMLYVLTGACSVAVLFAYITGSSFLYIEALGVTPSLFALLFGLGAFGFIGASQLNRLLLRRVSLSIITRTATSVAVLLAVLLLVIVASGYAGVYSLWPLLFLLQAALGCILPNIAALAFGHVRERMGSASALQGTTQSLFGAVSGTLVGALSNGETLPMMGVIAGFAVLAAVFLFSANRMRPQR